MDRVDKKLQSASDSGELYDVGKENRSGNR
jgi:hypothetical protein